MNGVQPSRADIVARCPAGALPPVIKKRADFLAARNGAYANGSFVRVQMRRNRGAAPDGLPRVGFTVTRKCGHATQRNRIKRRLREAVRLVAARDMCPQHDYVIISKANVLTAPFNALCEDVRLTVMRANKRAERNTPLPAHAAGKS